MRPVPAQAFKAANTAAEPTRRGPQAAGHFVFLLLDGFSLLSHSAAVETLGIADGLTGHGRLSWTSVSEDGLPVAASHGNSMPVASGLTNLDRHTTLILCGGDRIEQASSRRLLGWIRKQAAFGCHVGGLYTAAWTLAEAGLLTSSPATIHWARRDAFMERFPQVELSDKPFLLDGNRSSTAGGTSSIDLMLELVSRRFGPQVSAATSEHLLYTSIHSMQKTSKIGAAYRFGLCNPTVRRIIDGMDRNLDKDISIGQLAKDHSISVRQIERLFRNHLNQSPKRYLDEMRLDRARRLLMQTDMNVIDVATACGFGGPSHFAKKFSSRFGHSPKNFRGRF